MLIVITNENVSNKINCYDTIQASINTNIHISYTYSVLYFIKIKIRMVYKHTNDKTNNF